MVFSMTSIFQYRNCYKGNFECMVCVTLRTNMFSYLNVFPNVRVNSSLELLRVFSFAL